MSMPDVIYACEGTLSGGAYYLNPIFAPDRPYYSRAAVERAVQSAAVSAWMRSNGRGPQAEDIDPMVNEAMRALEGGKG